PHVRARGRARRAADRLALGARDPRGRGDRAGRGGGRAAPQLARPRRRDALLMLAVLYDIHGNLPALEAVLADAEAAGADRYFLGGDYSSLGAWPAETLGRLRELPNATWIRGNWERWLPDMSAAPDIEFVQSSGAWVRQALSAGDIAELAALPPTATIDGTLFSHGS